MLSTDLRRPVHIELCKQALQTWEEFCREHGGLSYIETVCGTKQAVDRTLPEAAIRSAIAGRDVENVANRYQEPIAAMQDGDFELPDAVEFAYYSIYNLFRRYVSGRIDDDWLIVNQALSAHGQEADYAAILESTMKRTGEQAASANGAPRHR